MEMINSIEMLENILSASSDGILAVNSEYRVIYWNTRMERLSGLKRAHALQQNIFDVLPLLKNSQENGRFMQAFDGEITASQNKLYTSLAIASDQKRFFKNHYSPLRSTLGMVIGAIVMVRDLTEQQEIKLKMEESEARFRAMSNMAPIVIWMTGKDGLCDFVNFGWLQFTGRSLEEALGVGWMSGIHPEDFQQSVDTYYNAFNARESFAMEYRMRCHDGEYRWLLSNGMPRYAPAGVFKGFIGSCVDITYQKSIMTKKRQMLTQLEEALQVRDNFLSIASHELKTPLTPLKIYLHTIQLFLSKRVEASPSDSEALFKLIDSMSRQVDHILKLVENLLDVSRMSVESPVLKIEEVDIVQIVHAVMERYQILMGNISCQFIFSNEKMVGRWDKIRIDQVVDNLLNNAIKYGAQKPIEIHLIDEVAQVKFIIRDQGIGIPKNAKLSIFNRFERVAPTENFGGLGLGLYIVKQNVLLHGGTIAVESDIDQGATFTVIFPKNLS